MWAWEKSIGHFSGKMNDESAAARARTDYAEWLKGTEWSAQEVGFRMRVNRH